MTLDDRRILLVHAHPDDESISNGATMARYAAEGVQVTLVTCTAGEEGEILMPEIENLASDRDAGMQWGLDGHAAPMDETREDTFWHADLTEASNLLVEVIREVRPQVLVTYDEFGGYGHPDHIQAHRVSTYGAALAAIPSYRRDLGEAWDVPKIYWS